jgi:AP-3 complex subunit mu
MVHFQSEKILSFVPPDGAFRLMSYLVSSQSVVAIPVYVRHNVHFTSGHGKLDLTIGPKQTMGRQLEAVRVEVPMPSSVLNCSLTSSQGKYAFDPVSKVLTWDIGKVDPQKLPNLRGTINLTSGAPPPDSNPHLNLSFSINQMAVSGLKVSRLDLYGEKYKPFKGVKYVTKAGRFQVRM